MLLVKYIAFILFFSISLFASSITVAVAANVSYAINDLIKAFNQINPDIKIKIILGGSGKLSAQIQHHAPYDIFMSANMQYPQTLFNKGYAVSEPIVYAKGAIVYFSRKKQNFLNKNLLLNTNIKKIAIANPRTAPYGKATIEALKNLKIYNAIKYKLVYGESISQTVIYALKVADIGIIAKSALFSPKLKQYKKNINWYEIDSKLYTPIKQGIIKLNNKPTTIQFYNFILNSTAQNIFKQYGYL